MPHIPEPFGSVYVTIVGLVVGSFLNVCIYRLPHGRSVVRPGSRCPSCGHEIRWYQNVPVLSWLLLRGRCSACRTRISIRYPLVEALTGLLTLALWLRYGLSPEFAVSAPFFWAMTVLFFTDLDTRLLPDAITLTGLLAFLAAAWFNPFLGEPGLQRIWMALSGAVLGGGFLWSVGALYQRVRGVEAMGFGDVKMMAFVGAAAGPQGVLFTIFGGSVAGAVVGLGLMTVQGRDMKSTLPFGCFLAPAAMAALLFGRQVIVWYLGLVVPGG
jgi:leader peptidase (prepilin peptidase)/N-methyltransferase